MPLKNQFRIAVYTNGSKPDNRSLIHEKLNFLSEENHYDYFDDLDEFEKALGNSEYDLIIFGVDNGKPEIARLMAFMKNTQKKNIPYVILKNNESSGDSVGLSISLKSESRKIKLVRPKESVGKDIDKLEIVAATTATLCHEINNPLMARMATTEVLKKSTDSLPTDIMGKIEAIADAAERIREATNKLMDLDSLKYREVEGNRMILLKDSQEVPALDDIRAPVSQE